MKVEDEPLFSSEVLENLREANRTEREREKASLDKLKNGFGRSSGDGSSTKEYVSDKDIEMYREELGNPLKDGNPMDTVAIGRTNIKGLEDCTFKGASSRVRETAGLADLDEVYPNRSIVAPYDYKKDYHLEQYAKHAEENVIAEFEATLEKAGIDPTEVKGDLYIRQSFTNGVCNKCTLGLFKSTKKDRTGIFKQFIEKYPHVNIYVSTYKGGGTGKGQGTLSFNIVDGKVTDVVKYANGRRY